MISKRLCLLVTATLLMCACTGSNSVVDTTDYEYVFRLVSVDGAAIPGEVLHDGVPLHISSGQFLIDNSGGCRAITVFTPPNGSKMTRDVSASYTRDGEGMVMKWKGAGTTSGTLTADSFQLDNHGMIFVYARQ